MLEKNRRKKRGIVFSVGTILLLAVGYLALCAAVKEDELLPKTVINGVAVGGMTGDEAVSALERDMRDRRNEAALMLSFEGQEYPVGVGDALVFDCGEVVLEALDPCRGNFLLRGERFLRALIWGMDLEVLPVMDRERLRDILADSGLLEADTTVQSSYREENGQLFVTMGQAGSRVDEDKLLQVVEKAVLSGGIGRVVHCPVVSGAVEPVDLEQMYREIYREAENARLDAEQGYQIVPSVTGVDFDRDAAQGMLDAAEEGTVVAIDLSYTEPEVCTQDLEEHLFEDVLAEFSTSVGGSANRRENIRLATEKCSGMILNAGDVFSFNDTVGEQTAETGFKKANAILDNQIIQAYGGGICQVSTTIFEAALYAALEIPERWWHTFISSYAAPGMDAAVAWDALDLKVENSTKYPVKLLVSYQNDRLTATFLGTKTEETPVEIETEVLDDSDGLLKMMTYRKIYSPDKSHFFREEIGYSEYLNSKTRID